MNTLALDIGGTKFSLGLFAGEELVLRETRLTDRSGGPRAMLSLIAGIISDWRREHEIARCGIGFGGPVDFGQQKVTLSTHVAGWNENPLVETISEMAGAPVVMDNDANVGALGEGVYGAGKDYRPMLYMTLSTGIGGGILTEHGLYRGADWYAGELGHLTIRPGGQECLCGAYGCFERMCCGLWLERDHGKPAHELLEDPEFVEKYVVDLALGLKAAIMILNPARIVIGGGISKAGDKLFLPLRKELRSQITSWSRARIDVVPALLADDSVLFGALALAQERFSK
ncbi:ROK family protein [Bryobacter aggregatus]|uniref:ROK family protein n=1 Tax=Bryobacter aggregatus TaxID=360054 RepID=UPI0004E1B76E|nr:ROK family protein [Bryobacter aggregatus]